MRSFLFFTLLFFCISCGGSLSNEQRKKMRENMEAGKIKKVSDAELTEATFEYAKDIVKALEKNSQYLEDSKYLDSLEQAKGVRIDFLNPSNAKLKEIEKALVEAYISAATASPPDNVQKIGSDSVLYTRPLMKERPDGSFEFVRALALRIPKKNVIKSIQ